MCLKFKSGLYNFRLVVSPGRARRISLQFDEIRRYARNKKDMGFQ